MGVPLYWIDAQLPPVLASWINGDGGRAVHVEEIGLLRAPDPEIFTKARAANAVVVTKDEDFVLLLESRGPPPQVVWITLGNVRNAELLAVWARSWRTVEQQVMAGEPLVEVGDLP
jgi:predicted nuclease of predicted toxin-antitoxin system